MMTVLRWPVREGLLAYREVLRAEALAAYRHDRLEYVILSAAGAKVEPPPLPPLLR